MKAYLSLVKFSHTVFALPFAIIGAVLGYKDGYPLPWPLFAKIILCMIFARSAAMAFNRWADAHYDKLNPRTAIREIPAAIISRRSVLWFVVFSCVGFIMTTYFINKICFYLSPVALLTVLGYSLTKRWTSICHLILGTGLALAPIGAYLAVTGHFSLIPLLFSGIVFYWVSGFDIIYALQDEEFDKQHRLFSIPAKLGKPKALMVSRILHLICTMIILFCSYLLTMRYDSGSLLIWLSAAFFIGMLIFQQSLIKPGDLSRINLAFFTVNGVASVVYGVLLGLDLLL